MVALVEVSSLMPLVIHPRVRKVVGRVAAMTCVAVFASTGAAFAASSSCPAQPLSTPFAQFGDTSSYFHVPGGSFEGTADQVGWSLSDAALTPGNETFQVGGAGDRQSLAIDAGGSATSPAFCVDNTMQSLRFFAKQTQPGAPLLVQAVVRLGHRQVAWTIGVVKDGSPADWAPVRQINLQARMLPAWLHVPAAVRFVVPGGQGSWQVDDVYVDPFRLG
jgi:hypothetical protein